MKKILFLLIVLNYVSFSQLIQKVDIYENNTNLSGQTIDVIAKERAKLFYTAGGNYFKYNYQGNNYFHLRLGTYGYPTTPLTTVSKEVIIDRPDKTLTVGSIAGEVSVDLTGAATYTIPITLVPGTNNVTPKISLNYNSNKGNGTVGWGWNLSGISAISRVGKDIFHDDVFEKIQFTNLDKLSLDGNRLVGNYGTNDAIYATEVGNTSRIYSHGLDNRGHTWFEVKNIDGSVIEFGNSVTSKFETEKGIMSWLVNKVTDANGNYVLYEYGKNEGEIFIKTISYTGNEKAGLVPYAKVEFIYKKKADNNTSYFEKIEFNETVILKEIQVKYENNTVRKYVLDYINDNNYSQLYRIIEWDVQENERYNSTIFEYDKTPENKSIINVVPTFISELDNYPDFEIRELFGDFNGDKISDRILISNELYMQFGKYFGKDEAGNLNSTTFVRQNNYSFIDPPDGCYQFTPCSEVIETFRLLRDQIIIADINNDGYDDVITPWLESHWDSYGDELASDERYRQLKIRIDTSDGNKLNYATEFTAIPQRLFPNEDSNCNHDFSISYEDLLIGDYDGDGFLELLIHARQLGYWDFVCAMMRGDDNYHILYYSNLSLTQNDGKGYININPTTTSIFASYEDDELAELNAQFINLNYNFNKKTDIMFITDTDFEYGFYEYNSLTNTLDKINSNKSNELTHANFYFFPADFNGDGLTDLLYYKNTGGDEWKVRYGIGSDFSDEYSIANFNFGEPYKPEYYSAYPLILDLNADGKSDIIWHTMDLSEEPHLAKYYLFTSIGVNNFGYKPYEFEENGEHGGGLLKNFYMEHQRNKTVDFNGDGNADIMRTYTLELFGDMYKKIITFNFEDNDLHLKSIYDGFNNKTEISYEPLSKGKDFDGTANPYKRGFSAAYPVFDIGGGGYVATSIKKYSAVNHLNPIQREDYSYEDGLTHLEGKGFLGFKIFTKKSFDLENLDKNFQTVISNELDAAKFSLNTKHIYNYYGFYIADYEEPNFGWNTELISEKIFENQIYPLINNQYKYFFYQSQIDENDYLNNTKSRTVLTVDEWGNNLSKTIKLGDAVSPIFTEITSNEYEDKIDSWITDQEINWCDKDKLKKTTVTTSHTNDTDPNDYKRIVEYLYDGAINNYHLIKIISDQVKLKKVETLFDYDNFGNILKTTLKQTFQSLPDRFSTSTFDNYGRFLIESENALGHKEMFNYNLSNGHLLDKTDINGIKTEYEYKGFSRLYKEIIPALNNSYTDYNTRWSAVGDPSGTSFVSEVSGTDMPESTVFYDMLGRDFISRTTSYPVTKIIETKKEYHLDGRIAKEYKPYEASTTPKKYIEYGYDDYYRILYVKDVNQIPNPPLELVTEFNYDNSTSNLLVKSIKTPDNKISYSRYDAAGLLTEAEDPAGNKVKYTYKDNGNVGEIKTVGLDNADDLSVIIDYDIYGNQIQLIDMDAGIQDYEYNAYGEVIKETHPTGFIDYEYDILGRLVKKKTTETPAGTSTETNFAYVNSGHGLGQIQSIVTTDNINEYYYYDDKGRIIKTVDDVQGKSFEYEYTYQSNGFPATVKYPSGVTVQNIYNGYGYLQKLLRTDCNPDVSIWELETLDVNENIRKFKLAAGNSTTEYIYDDLDYLTKIKTYKTTQPTNEIQNLEYEYYSEEDESGLLKIRKDVINEQSEEFTYDNLQRLLNYTTTNSLVQPPTTSTTIMSYYKDGSIKSKTGMGNYYYNDNHLLRNEIQEPVHAAKAVVPVLNPKLNHTITYTAFNSIKTIEEGLKKSVYYYGADEQRKKMEYKVNDILQYTKYYIGDYELIEYPVNPSKEMTYLDGYAVNIKIGSSDLNYYTHSDNLGSLQSLSDENGNAVVGAEYSFNPWGILRNEGNWLQEYNNESMHGLFGLIGRGFTGHEHMSEFGLINMNGRVYDQQLGQFIQPDNYIQQPDFSQSYNRFSYCLNNPLNLTDPSGELFGIDDIILYATIAYSVGSIAVNTYIAWNNYGQQAGLNTLITSTMFTAAGFMTGYAAGEYINGLLEGSPSINNYFGDAIGGFPTASARTATAFVYAERYTISETTKSVIRNAVAGIGAATTPHFTNGQLAEYSKFLKNPGMFDFHPLTQEPNPLMTKNDPSAGIEFEIIKQIGIGKTAKVAGSALKGLFNVLSKSKVATNICFIAGTMILTNNGLVEIEKIKTGDSVWSYNIESGKTELSPVQNIFKRSTNDFVKLYFAKDSIICTFEHPFFVNNDWKAAKDLKQGDSLFAYSGYKTALDSIYTFRTDTATAVYNLEADGNHNYYVSAGGVLVHNKDLYSVYRGIDASGVTKYVGITKRSPSFRFYEHVKSIGTGKELLKYDVIKGATKLTKTQARVLEQKLINNYGLENLLNKRNSIAPKFWSQHGI
ncbi:MAG: polymorphic toxin-type HINT domain-containing protein [Candidatus Kapabacteria bacterium]|nr:polymorphic toxin-type HINT domain-containing protein [Candidatus Kapabacteria bacterium]